MPKTKVALLMGSDSDLARLESSIALLREFEIPAIVRVLSAHRTPAAVAEFCAQAPADGIGVIIAAAGGAAHLAGALAAQTLLPVIGVPMDNPPLGGLDALLATVQMPAGIPVATVSVGGGGPKNAAFLAARILALNDAELAARLQRQRDDMAKKVLAKDARVRELNA